METRRDTPQVPPEIVQELLASVEAEWAARQRNRPAVVYHYTSLAGLKGIVTSGRIWATITSQLNDTTELAHASDVFKRILARHADRATLPEYRALYPQQVHRFDYLRPSKATTFVASFSGSEDDLSQWCMYGNRFRGCALGFDAAAFQRLDAADIEQNVGYWAVSYDETEKQDFFDWLVSLWERKAVVAFGSRLVRSPNPFLDMAHWFSVLATSAMVVFPRMKDSRFRGEDEWRMSHLHIEGTEDCAVSTQNGRAHVELRIGQLEKVLPLTSVWLGPAISNPTSEQTVRRFLTRHGLDVPVEFSRLPLRVEPEIIHSL